MRNKFKQTTVATLLVGIFAFYPLLMIQAQVLSDSGTTTSATTTATTEVIIDTGSFQDATSNQVTIPGNALESTLNPNLDLASSTPDVESSASSTPPIQPIVGTSTPDISIDVPEEPAPEPTPDQEQLLKDAIVVIDASDLIPKAEYSFRVGANKIGAKKYAKGALRTKGKSPSSAEIVNAELSTYVDSNTGELSFSGACASKYYVVLLYKNVDDYDINPRSYILNKAYPCENNSYSYSISSLPGSLTNGTYYLLVAEQSDEGAWTPITSITPVDINKN